MGAPKTPSEGRLSAQARARFPHGRSMGSAKPPQARCEPAEFNFLTEAPGRALGTCTEDSRAAAHTRAPTYLIERRNREFAIKGFVTHVDLLDRRT
jgi:hypothetical protein